jgi:acetyl esterase/lipase
MTRAGLVSISILSIVVSIAAMGALPAAADPVTLEAYVQLPRPEPTATLQYGDAASQGIDVFVPRGKGPHPVAILIHGGCWSQTTAGREQVRPIADALARQGIAVWSIGYRRANEPGGGYPGMYQDVGAAIDRVKSEAAKYQLDLARTVLVGHSAGGHLALWALARDKLPADSGLRSAEPFLPRAVVSLAGIPDLKSFGAMVPLICGRGIIENLVHLNTPDPFAETSPASLPPSPARIVMVSGIVDRLVAPWVAHEYAQDMRGKRQRPIELVDIPDAGHFDLVTPGTPAWKEISKRIVQTLAPAAH